MKKLYVFSVLFLLLSIVNVSAGVNGTIIGGVIYQGDINNGIEGVSVNVMCYHGGEVNSENDISGVNGIYGVVFSEDDCSFGDVVNVTAYYGSLVGTNNGQIDWIADDQAVGSLELDIGSSDVPLVPEFGFIVGMLTILSAVGIFFVVRKD